MIVLRRAHSLCETEVAPRFIPSLMIYLYHQGLFCDRKVKVSCLQEILETVITDEGKEGKNTKVGKRRKRYVK